MLLLLLGALVRLLLVVLLARFSPKEQKTKGKEKKNKGEERTKHKDKDT